MSKSEHCIQNEIRNALIDDGMFFRANVGTAWTGDKITKPRPGLVVIEGARPFSTGLPAGFPDLFGATAVKITPEMVGQTLAVFCAIECKTETGRASPKQAVFLRAVNQMGGRAGIARSASEAREVVAGVRA